MEKINRLRKILKFYDLDGYIIPKNDEFFGEYVPDEKDKLKYISNFSGSYGFAIIFKNKNYLFVDGRYSLQAKIQSGKFYKIFTIPNKMPFNVITGNLKIGFDPKLHTKKMLKTMFGKLFSSLKPIESNLVDRIWLTKKSNNFKKFFILPNKAVGQNYNAKINKIRNLLRKKKIDYHFISSGENISWLLNIRGNDSLFTPIPHAYLFLGLKNKIYMFCDLRKLNASFKKKLVNINFVDIGMIDIFLSKVSGKKILLDSSTCSFFFQSILEKNNVIINYVDPIYSLKSIKSKNEIKNTVKSHVYDGVALTKFLLWLKKSYLTKKISEISAQNKLLQFRKKNKYFKSLSFPTISGSGPNGAIIHYKATKKSNRKLKNGDIYLVDSGGQYNFGTTDVTRTISLGNNDQRIKKIFTTVLKSHIAVANFNLKKKTCGDEIDVVARKPLKKMSLDYAHGTGHGVGYFLNVHEGPQAISKKNKVFFKEGMIVSNEPGYYEKGKFGIRIENLLYVKKNKKGFYFENLTLSPIDKELINKKILKNDEINWLNNYHKKVFKNLKSFMNKIELSELKRACSDI